MRNKTKVIIDGEVLINPHFSGIGHYTLELLRALDNKLENERGFDACLLVHFRYIERAKLFGFKHIRIIPSPFSLRISNALKIRGKQPPLDLIFGKGIYIFPNFTSWPLLFSKSLPIIYDLSYEKYPQFAEPRNQAFLSTQVRKSTQRASRILTISKNSKTEIAEFYKFPKEKIDIIYPAVDRSRFRPLAEREVVAIKEKYDIYGEYILFVGNIEPRKNLLNLLLAYEQLPKELRQKYSLLLVGAKGWQDGEIFETINRLHNKGDRIQLPSRYVEDMDIPAIYNGASLFVYPSLYEGFGIPPVEAMACGVPVITSNNSSLPESCGNAAVLIDASSVKDLRSAIENLMSNPKLLGDLTVKGYSQADNFSWDLSADILLSSIKQI